MHRRAHNHLKSTGTERNQKEGGGREEMCPAGAREGAPCARTAAAATSDELRSVPTPTPLPSFITQTPTSMHFSIAKKYTLFLSNIQSTEAPVKFQDTSSSGASVAVGPFGVAAQAYGKH